MKVNVYLYKMIVGVRESRSIVEIGSVFHKAEGLIEVIWQAPVFACRYALSLQIIIVDATEIICLTTTTKSDIVHTL